jgi:hypothetical protein
MSPPRPVDLGRPKDALRVRSGLIGSRYRWGRRRTLRLDILPEPTRAAIEALIAPLESDILSVEPPRPKPVPDALGRVPGQDR